MHLSNGTELGPTAPVDMAPGQVLTIDLPATAASFTGWVPHAEVGGGEGSGSEGAASLEASPAEKVAVVKVAVVKVAGESGSEAAMEAAMSSPITPLTASALAPLLTQEEKQ